MDDFRPVSKHRVDAALRKIEEINEACGMTSMEVSGGGKTIKTPIELSERERRMIYAVFGRRGASYNSGPGFYDLPVERRMVVLRTMSDVGRYLLSLGT